MVKIPIEIIEMILDRVDLRSTTRFVLVSRNDTLDRYLEARLRVAFSECMDKLKKIYYNAGRMISYRRNHINECIVEYRPTPNIFIPGQGVKYFLPIRCIMPGLIINNCKFNCESMNVESINKITTSGRTNRIVRKWYPDDTENYEFSNIAIIYYHTMMGECVIADMNYDNGIVYPE